MPMSHFARSSAGMASSPAANSQPFPSFTAGRKGPSAYRAYPVASVSVETILIDVHDALHAERRKNVLLKNSSNGMPAAFSTISPAMTKFVLLYCHCVPGSKSSGLRAHRSRILSAVTGLMHERRNVVLRPVVLIARGMREQLANGDLVGAGQVGNVA